MYKLIEYKKRVLLAFLLLFTSSVLSTESSFEIAPNSFEQITTHVESIELHRQERWRLLLHAVTVPQINDPKFLLSEPKFDYKSELLATIEQLLSTENLSSDHHASCRFPARKYFIEQELAKHQINVSFPQANCTGLKTYIDYVPFEDLELVFASSDLNSATSMMGHIFLKVSGTSSRNNYVEHALSFYNEITSNNPVKLAYDGLISGMPGYFLVKPYQSVKHRYIAEEERNLWHYPIKADEYASQLLRLHLWELKDIDIRYLFQSYNCATLTLYILGLIEPAVLNKEDIWVTPIDVVKASQQANILDTPSVLLATNWGNMALPLSVPDQLQPDSSAYLAIGKRAQQTVLELGFLPASHKLEYDNRLNGYESELKMLDLSVLINVDEQSLKLKQLGLYSVTTLAMNPSKVFNASHFSVGIDSVYTSPESTDRYSNLQYYLKLNYGIGLSKRTLMSTVYTMLDMTLATDLSDSYFSLAPRVGMLAYVGDKNKVQFEISRVFNEINIGQHRTSLSSQWTYYLKGNKVVALKIATEQSPSFKEKSFMVSFDWLF